MKINETIITFVSSHETVFQVLLDVAILACILSPRGSESCLRMPRGNTIHGHLLRVSLTLESGVLTVFIASMAHWYLNCVYCFNGTLVS